MLIKILQDPERVYDGVMNAKTLVDDFLEICNEVEDADTITYLDNAPLISALNMVCACWCIKYEIISSL